LWTLLFVATAGILYPFLLLQAYFKVKLLMLSQEITLGSLLQKASFFAVVKVRILKHYNLNPV